MRKSAFASHRRAASASLFGATALGVVMLACADVNAADHAVQSSASSRAAPSRTVGANPFREARDFFDIASRTDSRFDSETRTAQAATATCIAGCYSVGGAGVIEVRVQSYEVLTSARLGTEPPAPSLVKTALSDGVRCVAGCSSSVTARAMRGRELAPAHELSGAVAHLGVQLGTVRHHRGVSRFSMVSPPTRTNTGIRALQRNVSLSRPSRSIVR